MNASLNPEPETTGSPRLINLMTATLDTLKYLRSTVEALNREGFGEEQVSFFFGEKGLEALDPLGDQHGAGMRVVRALQLFAGEEKGLRDAAATLEEGNALLSVSTDGTEEQKKIVESVLRANHAQNIHFFGRWTTENLAT